jgi:hypothetical protein
MSYGLLLNDKTQNTQITTNNLIFNSSARGGFSTTNTLFFNTFGFTTSEIQISFDQFVNLIPNGNVSLNSLPQTTNIDLNLNNGYYCGQNLSRPNVVNLCNIVGYETGVGVTVFNAGITTNSKVILNYSNPNYIFSIGSSLSTSSLNISNYSSGISSSYIRNENFVYVKNGSIIFLATYVNNNIQWVQIPQEKFYYNIDYYVTCTDTTFAGTSLTFNQFNRIVPLVGQIILINCVSFNDYLSGLYKIVAVTSSIIIQRYNISNNYPGQIFFASTNIDTSSTKNINSVCYYVPFEYGNSAPVFSKPLNLKQYLGLNTSINNFPLMFQDAIDSSVMHLPLTPQTGGLTQISDSFKAGIYVSNWAPDNSFIFGGLSYQIIEGS